LIALTSGRQIGVDIELVRPRPELVDLVTTFFAPAEQAALEQSLEAARCRNFYRLWTRKEAVLKASGQGITAGLKAPDVSVDLRARPDSDWSLIQLAESGWQLLELQPAPNYQGAIAVETTRRSTLT